MINIEDYVSGHEEDVEKFDFKGFQNDISNWHKDIKENLKKEPFDMTLLCVNAVLDTVRDIIYDNLTVEEKGE